MELSGRTLGDFVVRHRLGEGGYGAVYRAEQTALGREAVIKVLHDRLRHSSTINQRFQREARLASKLDHPYAAHVYGFGIEPDGLMWIAMEYVRGQTLHDILRARGQLPLEELVPLLDRICEVLQAAHDLGIVHRDIKPANVMVVQRAGRAFPKLLDFGIAKLNADDVTPTPPAPDASPGHLVTHTPSPPRLAVVPPESDGTLSFVGQPGGAIGKAFAAPGRSDAGVLAATAEAVAVEPAITEAGVAVGSPPYMAPEQWSDSAAATSRTDLYALGVMTYEALTGRRPFTSTSTAGYATAHATAAVPPLGGTLPKALDEVMQKVLSKNAGDRHANALELAQAFRAAAGFGTQPLPLLDEDLRVSVETNLPQPIAEAVSAYRAARNAHQGRDALREIGSTAIRYLAVVALSAQAQVRLAEVGNSDTIARTLRELRRRALRDEEWLELATLLVASFRARPQAHPMPELVTLLASQGELLAGIARPRPPDPDPLGSIHEMLPEVTRLLRALTFLADYPLVVVAQGLAESWMGVRKPRRVALEVHGRAIEPKQPVLLDAAGRPTIVLWPCVQASSPMPNAPEELFLLDGGGRRGARMVAPPNALERQDERVWEWLADTFASLGGDAPVSPDTETRPYRGLAAFALEDADAFVGREREVDAAINRLRASALVAVVGPSGAGKSSFVHAGIVPSLPSDWATISVRPGATPLATLEQRLRRAGVELELARDPGALADAFATPTLLVVDQFEELFTLGAPLEERRAYVRALLSATEDDKLRVVLTLRDDFLGRATQMPELRDRLATSLFLLGTPAREDLIRILTQPMVKLGFDFDDAALPERMVDSVAETPGALALLSFTASKLWELRDRRFRQLTRAAYDSLGGVAGALAQHAEATLVQLSPHEQWLARTAFAHLVTAEGTRAALTRGEIDQLLRDPAASTVLEKLVGARLLVTTESESGDDRVEIVHEALIVAWPRLEQWRLEDAEGARLRDQVRAAARQWVERDRPRGLLWRDDALAELQIWRARHTHPLTDAETAFVDASLAEATRGRRLRRGVIVVVIALMAIAVAVLLWARANEQATAARDRERVLRELVERGRQNVLAGDSTAARAAFAEARELGAADSDALRFLETIAHQPLRARAATLGGHTAVVIQVQFSPDGERLLTASADGTARVWNPASGAELAVLTGCAGALLTASFDPAGRRILTECDDGVVRIFDAAGHLEREIMTGHAGSTGGFARFSPDGTWIATSTGGVVERWDATTGRRAWGSSGAPQGRIALSPDGTLVASLGVDEPTATLRDASTGAIVRTLALTKENWEGPGLWPVVIAFDATGRRLVTVARSTEIVQIWDVATGTLEGQLEVHAGPIETVRLTRDGKRALIGSREALQIWSIDKRRVEHTLAAGTNYLMLALAPDDTLLGTTHSDGSLTVWHVASGTRIAMLHGHTRAPWSVAFDPRGDRIATGGADAATVVWNVRTAAAAKVIVPDSEPNNFDLRGRRLLVSTRFATVYDALDGRTIAQQHIGPNADARFVDDRTVAIVDGKRAVSLWDLERNAVREVARHTRPIEWLVTDGRGTVASWAGPEVIVVDGLTAAVRFRWHAPADVTALAIAGDRVVIGDARGHIHELDAGGRPQRSWRTAGSTVHLIALPDGRLISASRNVAQVWSDGQLVLDLPHPTGKITHAVADRTGRQLATSSVDGTVQIWDLASYARIGVLRLPSWTPLAFSQDDRMLVTLDDKGTVRVWSVASGEELLRSAALHGRGLIGATDDVIVALGLTSIVSIPIR